MDNLPSRPVHLGLDQPIRRQYWQHVAQSDDSIHLEVGHELLLLCEHGLERVELRLQLLNGDLALAHRCSRILQGGLDRII